ncbi:MAG TPA: hypothetical protein VLK89_02535 [Solirubrobacterales bacterium]|nr:hypothetical protein [Solirubrobacterales bacterium]
MTHKTFIDYDGPTGLYVATGEKILPLDSVEGISAVAQSAMLTSLGSTPEAKEYQAAMQHSLAVAHEVDASANA